ncbi:uncharacterized protein LOC134189754 isoform X2 [Corticium candelabrum]|uniref:uncharacterized protein LOC134189754 isoform X2 n=1 Tax=Corticium candelabrum TaxID=121492 RepID=UPI002E255984|nr:uncharacterized protein LOC134189754 isoform X2 [Corticium candelabrum]
MADYMTRGDHLLSYSTKYNLSDTFDQRRVDGCFSLHWWRFDQRKPLKISAICNIFRGEFNGCDDPLLSVCEDADSNWIVTFGMFPLNSQTDSVHECFVSIAPNPVKLYPTLVPIQRPEFCLCLKYELCPPFPKITPELTMRIPNTVIVNTGAFVMALRLGRSSADPNHSVHTLTVGNTSKYVTTTQHSNSLLSVDILSDELPTDFASSDIIRLVFTCDDVLTRLSHMTGSTVPKPDCVLMFDVVSCWGEEMKPVTADIWDDKCCTQDNIAVPVVQVIFNVDRYLSYALQSNKDIAGRVKAVMDYDMEVVDVCVYSNQVIILLKSLVKAFSSTDTDRSCPRLYTMGFLLAWNAWTGETKTLVSHSLQETTTVKGHSGGLGTLQEAWEMRNYEKLPTASCKSVKILSNRTLFTGHSLKYVLHPTLPLYLFHQPL